MTDELDEILNIHTIDAGNRVLKLIDVNEAKQAIQALIAKEVLRGKREEVIEIVSWGSKGQDRAIKRLAELNKQIGDSDDR